jgi:hypothetical protein
MKKLSIIVISILITGISACNNGLNNKPEILNNNLKPGTFTTSSLAINIQKKFNVYDGLKLVKELKKQFEKDYEQLKKAVRAIPGLYEAIIQVPEVAGEMNINLDFATKVYGLGNNGAPVQGLVAWYPFNGNAADESGNGNNGTVNGATLTTDRHGKANKAYFFTDYNKITANVSGLPVGNADRTMSMWFRMNSNDPENEMLLIYGNPTPNDATYFVETLNTLCQGKWGGGDTCNSTNINDNTWHHALLTYDSVNKMKFYLDGAFIGGRNENYSTSTTQLIMGSYFHRYHGSLDEIRLYNRALNEREIQAVYQAD